MNTSDDHFWRKPTEMQSFYNFRMLGYVNVTCVIIGTVLNTFMIVVFTRKNMISPINTILTHYIGILTICGIVYTPRTYHELLQAELCAIPEHNTYAREMISYHSLMAAATFRHFAVWMAVMIGVWRYIAVIHPLEERQYCNMENTRKVIVAGYILISLTTTLPAYFAISVGPAIKLLDQDGCLTANFTIGKNVTIYEFQCPLENYPILYHLSMAVYSVSLKLLPTLVLTFISVRLIKTIIYAKKRRKEMVAISGRKNTYNRRVERRMREKTDRTTIMLLVILALFLMAEVPQGIYPMFAAFYGPQFMWKYWYPAQEMMDSLTYVSEVFNFIIYYAMSREFRKTFKALFEGNSNNSTIVVTPQTSSSSLPVA